MAGKLIADTLQTGTGGSVDLPTIANQLKWSTVFKAADTSRASTTALVADPDLKFAMLANTTYRFRACIMFTAGATGDCDWRHTGPASPTLVRIMRQLIVAGGTAFSSIAIDTAYSSADIAVAGGAGTGEIYLEGIIKNGANAGDFSLTWAQTASDVTATVWLAGSYIDYAKVT